MERELGRFSPQIIKLEKQEVMQLIHGFREGILPPICYTYLVKSLFAKIQLE